MSKRLFSFTILLVFLCGPVFAAGLVEVYQAALENDPQWSAQQHKYESDKQSVVQGRGALLPSVAITGNRYSNETDTEEQLLQNPSLDYHTQSITGSITQPLFHMNKIYQYQQVRENDKKVEFQYKADRQEFISRVVEAYFAVLRAEASLEFVQADQAAIGKQLEQAKSRFEVGLSSISDVHEAQAAYDLTEVNRILADNELSIARENLVAITGISLPVADVDINLKEPFTLEPQTEEDWVMLVLEQNYQHRMAMVDKKMANLLLKERKADYLPTVDLVARKTEQEGLARRQNIDPVTGVQLPPSDGVESEATVYGIEFKATLFQGGIINSRRKQASLQYHQAAEQFEYIRRTIVQDTRNSFRRFQADRARLKAREQAVTSSQSALDGAEAGYEVGERNIVDLLDAQRRYHGAVRDLFNSQLDYCLDYLRLQGLAARLDESMLELVASRLVSR